MRWKENAVGAGAFDSPQKSITKNRSCVLRYNPSVVTRHLPLHKGGLRTVGDAGPYQPSPSCFAIHLSQSERFFGRIVIRLYDLCIFLRFVLQFCILPFAFCITRFASATRVPLKNINFSPNRFWVHGNGRFFVQATQVSTVFDRNFWKGTLLTFVFL